MRDAWEGADVSQPQGRAVPFVAGPVEPHSKQKVTQTLPNTHGHSSPLCYPLILLDKWIINQSVNSFCRRVALKEKNICIHECVCVCVCVSMGICISVYEGTSQSLWRMRCKTV